MNLDFSVLTRDTAGSSIAGDRLGNYQKLSFDDDSNEFDYFDVEIKSNESSGNMLSPELKNLH